tara:strand:+ start:218 stop:499 length:282 start_codon:yes stop_codon:yes gene_type:complete
MDSDRQMFIYELQKTHKQINDLVSKYGMQDSFVGMILTGLIDRNLNGEAKIEAIWSYSVDNQQQFDEIINFAKKSYSDEGTSSLDGFDDICLN